MRITDIVLGLSAFLVPSASAVEAGAPFRVPPATQKAVWEAEQAQRRGRWQQLGHPWASGGAYVRPEAVETGTVLEFPFHTDGPATLRVWPQWWRHGERKPAKRFPYPLPSLAGPDVVDWHEDLVFFTAPASGRLGVFDATTDFLLGAVDLGGYLADMVVDREMAKVYVADAQRNMVLVLNARRYPREVEKIKVPQCPWSLALHKDKLYVACREGKAVAMIDCKSREVLKTVGLDVPPVHVEVVGKKPAVVVWPVAKTFDMFTFEEVGTDREQYPAAGRQRSAQFKDKTADSPGHHVIRIRGGGKTKSLDVKPVTGGAKAAERFLLPLKDNPGPDVMGVYGKLLFFTSPATGKVGVVDMQGETLAKGVAVGGYLADLAVDQRRGKVYVADALGSRVVVLDAKKQSVVRELKVPAQPWSLALVYEAAIQRPGLVPPYPVNKLFVACRKGKAMAVIDTSKDEVVNETKLPGEAVQVKAVPLPNVGWWPLLASDDIPFALRPRVAVRMAASTFDVSTLRPVTLDAIPERFARRRRVRVNVAAAQDARRLAELRSRPTYGAPRLSPKIDGDLSDWAKITPVRLPASERANSLRAYPGWTGRKDLSGHFYLGWDDRNLYFAAAVTDEKFHQPHASDIIWQADCIQVAFDLLHAGSYDREYGLALAAGAPFTWCWHGPAADARRISLAVKKRPDGLSYEAAIPWGILKPLPPAAGKAFGFTVAVMDSDGGEREGCLEWTPGIVDGKDALAFGTVALVQTQSKTAVLTALSKPPSVRIKSISADNSLTLRVDKRWIDVSSATDPQLLPSARPLAAGDLPGTVTLSVDDGPEHDWTRDMWMTPDQNLFLVAETDDFWRWNAPTFRVGPGRHVLKVRARSPFARMDALAVRRSLERNVELHIDTVPWNIHGVFCHNERVRFALEVRNLRQEAQKLSLHYAVRNYMGEVVTEGKRQVALPDKRPWRPTPVWGETLDLELRDTGRHTLAVRLSSADGELVRDCRFLRLPKLEHPRLLFRREDIPAIKARIQKRPELFRRYLSWLRRQSAVKGEYYPERFLPSGLTGEALGKAAPPKLEGKRKREQTYGWRMFDLGWRMLACQFGSEFLASPGEGFLDSKVQPLLKMIEEGRVGRFCTYHHHGPLFPGAVASLYDIAAKDSEETRDKLGKFFARHRGNMNLFPWTLAPLEEPLSPNDRALLSEMMMWETNLERYFDTHCGRRGGTWWLNPWTSCQCPLQGMFVTFLYCRNFFDEPRLFEKKFFSGFLTFHRYVDPHNDKHGLIPKRRGPSGEPFQWMQASLCGHPLEKKNYRWDEWVRKLEGKMAKPEGRVVDELFGLGGMPFVGSLRGGVDHFVTGVSVPLALAFGWYKPGAPEVGWEELPPTALFDVEGWACMRSGWDKDATELSFISGVRDHAYRHHPNHFTILKAGEFLINTSSLFGDDGNSTPCLANVVAVGKDWTDRWRINLQPQHPRQKEYCVINRYSPATWRYLARDRRLCGYSPAEGGWGGGLDLHGHTESLFVKDGEVVAYETWPELDYVAGDATNSWPVEQVSEMYRQLVYVKPDVIVIYDRAKLARPGEETSWVACTAPTVSAQGRTFSIKRRFKNSSVLHGSVLLPVDPVLSTPKPYRNFQWRGQKVLEIRPAKPSQQVEYLVVMNVGNEGTAALAPKLVSGEAVVGVEFACGKKSVRLMFRRDGVVGGHISITGGPRPIDHELVQKVDDSYRHWNTDPRFKKWTTEPRFRFLNITRD